MSNVKEALDQGRQHLMAGRLAEAKNIYQQILQADPEQPVALHLLGVVALQTGKPDIAANIIAKAVAAKPDFAEAHNNLGLALQGLGRLAEAVASNRQAVAIKADYVEAHNNLGVTLKDLGQLDDAIASYRAAIAIRPNFAEDHRHLALAKTFTEDDDDLKAMAAAYATPDGRDDHKIHLAFGLGKAFEDVGEYDKAFDFFVTGNTIKRGTFDFSIDRVEEYFERLKETFNVAFFAEAQAAEPSTETPVFILGMLRSGTTLVEQILFSHPAVHGAGELECLRQVIQTHFNPSGDSRFTDSISHAGTGAFSAAGHDYMAMLGDRARGATFITDKMPHNFEFIGFIKLMLPNAKIVHCCRDGRDTCLSIYKNYFSAMGNFHAYDLAELGRYHGFYRDLMAHWHQALPGFVHDIQYEDLVADQEDQSRALLEFCGLE